MDLELHRRVNDDSLAILQVHARFRHRFLLAYEFHHLATEKDVLSSSPRIEAQNRTLRAGKEVRRRILERLPLPGSTIAYAPQPNDQEEHGSSISKYHLDASTSSARMEIAGSIQETRSLNLQRIDKAKFLEFQLYKEIMRSMTDLYELKGRVESRKKRIEEQKRKRAIAMLQIRQLERDMKMRTEGPLDIALVSMREREALLLGKKSELMEAISLASEGWYSTIGPDEAALRLKVLKLAMNAFFKGSAGASMGNGWQSAVKFFVGIGVLKPVSQRSTHIELNLRP